MPEEEPNNQIENNQAWINEGEIEAEDINESEIPEEEKEYQNNVAKLIQSAEEFLLEKERKKIEQNLDSKEIKLKRLKPVLTIERQKKIDEKRGFSLKDKMRKASFSLRLGKKADDMMAFVHYLEENIRNKKRGYPNVKESNLEKEKAKYQKDGYTVEVGDTWPEDKEKGLIKLNIEKTVPYEFYSTHTKKLAELLVQENDPIEVLERSQHIGFQTNGSTFKPGYSQLEGILSFTSSRDIINLLKKLEQINVEGYHYFGNEYKGKEFKGEHIEDAFLDFAERDAKEGILTPEVQKKLLLILENNKNHVNLEDLEIYLDNIQNEKKLNFILFLNNRIEYFDIKNDQTIRNLELLEENGLIESFSELLKTNISLPDFYKLFDYQGRKEEDAREIIKDLKMQVESPELKDLLEDKELLSFTNKITSLIGQSIHLDDLQKYKKLQDYPEAIAIFGLLREWKIKNISYDWKRRDDSFFKLFENKNLLSILINPEFNEFVKNIQEKLGYEMNLNDLSYSNSNILELFNKSEVKGNILSESGVELINYLGKFNSDKISYYEQLTAHPNILPVLKKLEQSFDFRYGESGNFYGADELIKLAQNEEQQENLFSNKTIDFVKKLQKVIDYQFQPDDILKLAHEARTGPFPFEILEKENVEFINKVVTCSDLQGLDELTRLKDEDKEFFLKLAESFDYKVNARTTFRPASFLSKKNRERTRLLVDNKELQKELFSKNRVEMINKIRTRKNNYYFDFFDNIEVLVKLPIDFPNFLEELKEHRVPYSFNPKNLIQLEKISKNKEIIFNLIDVLNENNISYDFDISQVDNWIEASADDNSKLAEQISYFSQVFPKYKLEPTDFKYFIPLVEAGYKVEDIREFQGLYDKYKTQNSDYLDVALIPKMVDLRENEEAIISTYKELEGMNITWLDSINDTTHIKDIARYNLLPAIKFFKDYGAIHNVLKNIEFLREFSRDHLYEDMIRNFKILHGFNGYFSFDVPDLNWHQEMAKIPDTAQKLEEFHKSIPFLDMGSVKIFVACNGDIKKTMEIKSVIDDEYFAKNKDAQHNLDIFVEGFRKGEYSMDMFVNIMTLSKDPRKTKQLFMRTMALDQLQNVIDPEQKVDYSFLEESKNLSEILDITNEYFVEKAVSILFSGEDSDESKELKGKIEKLLSEDDGFEYDFETIASSISIYAKKYPLSEEHNKSVFNELMSALRQATKLICIRDTEEFKQERFNHSKEQFDRIFEQIPEIDRASIEKAWLDTSQIVKGSLDESSVTKEQGLKHKLSEIKRIFEIEVLPDLSTLFKNKIALLEELVEQDVKSVDLFKTRLAVFEEYVIDEEGEIESNFMSMYRKLSKDIRNYEKSLRSKETDKDEKKKISKKLGVMKYIKDALKGVYKLSNINPDKIEIKKDYAEDIDDIVELISSNLHKLALVDKEKEAIDDEDTDIEIDIRDHLEYLGQVIKEEDHQKKIKIQTQFVVDFKDLAHCPELTNSCQRLTEVTGYNEAAYSRILDGINELIDVWEIKTKKGKNKKSFVEKQQRLARCFTELTTIKVPEQENPKLAVLLDRMYISPNHTTFYAQCLENVLKVTFERFSSQPEISIILSPMQFTSYKDQIESLASKHNYSFNEISNVEYFVNESNLKISRGKYYDSHGGLHDTSKSYNDNTGAMYVLEKVT